MRPRWPPASGVNACSDPFARSIEKFDEKLARIDSHRARYRDEFDDVDPPLAGLIAPHEDARSLESRRQFTLV